MTLEKELERAAEPSRARLERDPQRGIELAELALLSLDVSASALGGRIDELRALGWAWVGNARRLALDFPGAEEAFEKAVEELALVKDWEESIVAAEVFVRIPTIPTTHSEAKRPPG